MPVTTRKRKHVEAKQPQVNFCLLLEDAFWNYVGVCCRNGIHFWLTLLPKMSIVSRHFCFCSETGNQNKLHAMFHDFCCQFHESIIANHNKLHEMFHEFHLVIRPSDCTGLNKFNLNSYINLNSEDAQAQQMRLKEMLDMVERVQTLKLELLRSYNDYKNNEAQKYRHASLSDFIHHFWGDDHFTCYILAALQTNALATLDPLRSGIEVTGSDLVAFGSSTIENFFGTLRANTWAHNNLPSGFSVSKQISQVLHDCIRECHVELRDAGYTDVDYLIEDDTDETGLNEQRLSAIGVNDEEMQTDLMKALRELRTYN
jgi:hypothetical protein